MILGPAGAQGKSNRPFDDSIGMAASKGRFNAGAESTNSDGTSGESDSSEPLYDELDQDLGNAFDDLADASSGIPEEEIALERRADRVIEDSSGIDLGQQAAPWGT